MGIKGTTVTTWVTKLRCPDNHVSYVTYVTYVYGCV
jgi:hypothetical protein